MSAETPMLQTDRTDTGRILESKMVAEMPLTFNRNFQSLLIVVPGSTRPHREHSAFFNSQDSLAVEINGQPRQANNTLIEGLDNNHKTGLLQVIIPAADALETVSISTSNYDAEFGRSGGAVTNVTLKSGTNDLKGSAFFFGNTDATNASDYFTHLKAPTTFANGGFTLGGPIVRNKLFFFGDYQRTIDNFGYVVRATVPTLRMRNGDFGEVTQRVYDPLTGDIGGTNRVPFANNQVPQDRISPIARTLIGFIPEPNIPGAPIGQNNYQKAQTREKTTDGFDVKVNHTLTQKDQLSYRASFMRPVVFDPGLYGIYGGPANGGFAGTGTNTSTSTAMTWTRVFSATTVLDVRGGLNYYHNVTSTEGNGLTTSTEVGIPGANLDEYTSGLTQINIGGYSGPVLGFSASQPWDRSEKTWNVATTLTRLLNTHTVKFGGEWRNNVDVLLQTQDAGGPRGNFNFNTSGTGVPSESASLGVANSFASFLLDWPNTVQRDLKVIDQPGTKHWATALFVHDKWQARSNVTVDLGLRWEYYNPLEGIDGKGTLANYDPVTNTIRVAGYGDTTNAVNVKRTFRNFAPCTGVSWRLNDRTVLRAGYGASAIPFPDNRYAFNFPVKQNYNGTVPNAFQRAGTMAAGFLPPVLLHDPVRRRHSRQRNGAAQLDLRRDSTGPARRHPALLERRVPAAAAVPAHRRHRLRRQSRCRPRDGRRHEREPRLRVRQQRTPAVRAVCPHRQFTHADEPEQVGVQRAPGEAGPALQPRPDDHQLVHAQPLDGLRERERRHRHADRLRVELGARELRPAAQLRAHVDLRAAVGAGQAVDERQHARQDRGRLAGQRPVQCPVGYAAHHHRERGAAQHARQHGVRESERRPQDPRGTRPRPAVLRPGGLFASGGGHPGQSDAQ